MKVGIIGHYGLGLNLANGQTIKTKIVTDAIEKELKESVYKIDAHGGIKAVIPVVFGCIMALIKCDNVIVMLTENGLKVTVPVLNFFNRFYRKNLHYIVIGGWLEVFLNNNPSIENKLKKFRKIYVETNTMFLALEKRAFTNVVVMPNCKELTILKSEDMLEQLDEPLKICTFSRVMKEKGIEDIVTVVNEINFEKELLHLDIYGQIDETQNEWFHDLTKNFNSSITYGGIISFDKSVEVLKNYHALVFPTRFFTEGIPGTIIDAYAAGIPVISAKWESFDDVVEDGKTGIGYTFDSIDDLRFILKMCIDNPGRLNQMKQDCLEKAEDFTVNNVMKILMENLR